jgi:amidophosphoribosyltransferase
MIKQISQTIKLTTLEYQKLEDQVNAVGVPEEKACTYCWDSAEFK